MSKRKCGCVYTDSRMASVRKGLELSGALISECETHQAERVRMFAALNARLDEEKTIVRRCLERLAAIPEMDVCRLEFDPELAEATKRLRALEEYRVRRVIG